MSVFDRSVRSIPSHPHPPNLKEVPDTVLRVDNNQKSELQPTQVFPFVGYVYHLDLALVKPTRRDGSIFRISTLKVKTCFDCKMFDISNWVAHLNGEDGPGGMPSHETPVSPQVWR